MKYRAEIDGLRALSIISVLLYHAGFKLFGGGYVGVDVFFVISGYLITTIILAELEADTFSLIHFYERRARRIMPALFLVMFMCLPFAWFWLLPNAMKQFSESLVAVSAFASNILFWWTADYFNTETKLKPLIHTWSLAVEEQYYLLFPLFLMLTWKFGKRWIVGLLVLVFVISLAGSRWLSAMHPPFAFYMLPTRGWELLIGAFIAFYYSHYNIKNHNHIIEQLGSFIGLLLISYSIFTYNDQTSFPSIYALVPTLGAALIIIFATHKTVVGKLLALKPLVAIGLISYSTYLWHQPMFAFARELSLGEPSQYLMSTLTVLSFIFAYLSWRYVERPFRNKHRISRNKVFAYGALCSALFIGIGLLGYMQVIPVLWQIQNPNLINIKYAKESTLSRNCTVDIAGYRNVNCDVSGEGKKVIVVWGDSHAGVLSKNIPTINGVQINVISHGGCPPVIGVRRFDGAGSSCNDTKTLTDYAKFIESLKPETVVLVGRWTLYLNGRHSNGRPQPDHHFLSLENGDNSIKSPVIHQAILEKQLRITIEYFSKNSNVLILSQPPDYAMYSFKILEKYDFKLPFDELINWHKEEERILKDFTNSSLKVKVFDSKKLFCSDKACNTRINGVLLYDDDNHLTSAASQKLWEVILDQSHKNQ